MNDREKVINWQKIQTDNNINHRKVVFSFLRVGDSHRLLPIKSLELAEDKICIDDESVERSSIGYILRQGISFKIRNQRKELVNISANDEKQIFDLSPVYGH
uniref:Uncharacterized protein n=1 Tax=Romanomermis culicivorax TaxID=13658 RepID=A0A915ICS8_ROMCU